MRKARQGKASEREPRSGRAAGARPRSFTGTAKPGRYRELARVTATFGRS
jgi:hypothetical protein